jgi:hypothetical protein
MYVLYYVSMLRCWHLIWILVKTDHPYLGVGCHKGDLRSNIVYVLLAIGIPCILEVPTSSKSYHTS